MTEDTLLEVDGGQYGTITEAIVHAAGAVRNETPVELEPLYDAVDPDALERLVASDGSVAVTFEYADLTVSVSGCRRVRVLGADDVVEAESG